MKQLRIDYDRTYDLILSLGGHGPQLQWVWSVPFGVPFAVDCIARDVTTDLMPLMNAAYAAGGKDAFHKTFEVRVRGTIRKRFYTWAERRENFWADWDVLDKRYLPLFDREVAVDEILSVAELSSPKQFWLSLQAILLVAGYLLFWAAMIGTCARIR